MAKFDDWGNSISQFIENGLNYIGVNPLYSDELKFVVILLVLTFLCFVSDFIAKKILLGLVGKLVKKTKTDWDDVLIEKKFFTKLAHVVPALVLEGLIPSFLKGHQSWIDFGLKASHVYLVVVIIAVLVSLLSAAQVLVSRHPFMKDKPMESYTQLIRIIIFIIGGIYLVSILLGRSPLGIFSALGAMSVVLMLVFKDTILGFVGSIQLAANNMIRVGDWVEFPKYGADGDVVEIKLQTIKIMNWDKTISTVPTYAFVSDAFKNWRGMEESGGRRIKRSINIDMNTVKLCDEEMLERFKKIQYISEYLDKKKLEVDEFNEDHEVSEESLVNGRAISNMGTFRAYVHAYLSHNEILNKDMTFLVRQLQSTEKGLPLEIYVFSTEKRWAYYEDIQADIFDHILSVVKEFDLQVFQSPSGSDFNKILK
ncbi:MAG: miniconductance mechanosensitive channel [Saprospiraceae bacterium]|jgi:miniconductance mechanosensitive channel